MAFVGLITWRGSDWFSHQASFWNLQNRFQSPSAEPSQPPLALPSSTSVELSFVPINKSLLSTFSVLGAGLGAGEMCPEQENVPPGVSSLDEKQEN